VPTIGKLGFGISIITTADVCAMACFGDKNSVENPQEIVDIFVKKYE
jgi:hypothetical protein